MQCTVQELSNRAPCQSCSADGLLHDQRRVVTQVKTDRRTDFGNMGAEKVNKMLCIDIWRPCPFGRHGLA